MMVSRKRVVRSGDVWNRWVVLVRIDLCCLDRSSLLLVLVVLVCCCCVRSREGSNPCSCAKLYAQSAQNPLRSIVMQVKKRRVVRPPTPLPSSPSPSPFSSREEEEAIDRTNDAVKVQTIEESPAIEVNHVDPSVGVVTDPRKDQC